MEVVKQILIIDDIEYHSFFNLLKIYRTADVKRLYDLRLIKEELKKSQSETTIILLNAHTKFNESDLRCSLRGMWLLRYKLRTEWRKQEPVIIYSPLNREKLIEIPHNSILQSGAGHYFLNIVQVQKSPFRKLVKEAEPVPKEQIDFIIKRYCTLPALIGKYANHDLANELKKDKINVQKIKSLCEKLSELMPKRSHDEFNINDLLNECNNLEIANNENNKNFLQQHIEKIQEITKPYGNIAKTIFANYDDTRILIRRN